MQALRLTPYVQAEFTFNRGGAKRDATSSDLHDYTTIRSSLLPDEEQQPEQQLPRGRVTTTLLPDDTLEPTPFPGTSSKGIPAHINLS